MENPGIIHPRRVVAYVRLGTYCESLLMDGKAVAEETIGQDGPMEELCEPPLHISFFSLACVYDFVGHPTHYRFPCMQFPASGC